ncbi:MAG: SOS response-associated peptidase [Parvibaculaceae bacterium]
MCNLYRLRARPDHLRELLQYVEDHDFPPRSHVSPGSPIAIVRADRGIRHLALVRWGFVPSWAKGVAPGKPLTNARIETLLEKASFRNAARRRRCLIPADGYYEWSGAEGRKQAHLVTRADGRPFAFAGLWEHWLRPDGSELETAAIVTTAALPPMEAVHPRMPMVVAPHLHREWLANESADAGKVLAAVNAHTDRMLVVEPIELERRAPPPKPAPAETGQLTLL